MESTHERLLHCTLCNSRFQDIPCQLPCLHSFCEHCLVHLLEIKVNDLASISSVPLNDNSKSESHEEKTNETFFVQVREQSTSVDEANKKDIQDIGIETDKTKVESKVKEAAENVDVSALSNDIADKKEISKEREIVPAARKDSFKNVKICYFIACQTCKLKMKLTPLDRSIIAENQLDAICRVVRASFPHNHFLSHLLSIRMRSIGKKDCEVCKMRQHLIKDGKKREKLVSADSMCVKCDQLMCHQCRVAHDGFKPFQSHTIFDIIPDESKGLFSLPFRRQQHLQQPTSTVVVQTPVIQIETRYECPTHLENIIMVCTRCQIALCSQCMISHYRNNTSSGESCPAPILLSEAATIERQNGKILLTKLSEHMQPKLKFIDKLNELIEKSDESKTIFKTKMNTMATQMKEAINSSLQEVCEKTEHIVESKKEKFQRMVEDSKIQTDVLKELSTYLEVALSQALDQHIRTVIQDVNKAFTSVQRNEIPDKDTYEDYFNYGDILTSLMEKCLAITLQKNQIEFKSNKITAIKEKIINEGQSNECRLDMNIGPTKMSGDEMLGPLGSERLSSTEKRQSSYLLHKPEGDLKHAFLGSINELWDSNKEVLLFDLVILDRERIIISDFHNQRIKEFDESGHLLACCAVEGSPTGVCVVSEHQLICALTWSKKLCFIMRDARGNFLAASSTVSVAKQYCGIALMATQTLLCSYNNSVDLISFDGTILRTLTVLLGECGPLLSPRYILILPGTEYFWLSDAERASLICCSIDGNVKYCYSGYAGRNLSKPSGLSMDKRGSIYMADSHHNCIYRLTADGELDKLLFTNEDGILKPRGVAVNADGTKIYLSEVDSGIVKVLNIE